MTTVAYEFRNPDGDSDFAKLVVCLEFMSNLPSFQKYKKQSWRLLDIQPNDTVVDVACGIGYDVAELGKAYPEANFIGVDLSSRFLDIAKSHAENVKNVTFIQGDARAIPLEDKKCNAIRIDRSLQHIQNPGKVLSEMARVTVTGGRVVASEPDWGTFTLCNGDLETSMMLTSEWTKAFANPYIGRCLATLFVRAGVHIDGVEVDSLVFRRYQDAAVVFDLESVVEAAVRNEVLGRRQAQQWIDTSMEATRAGMFFASLSIVTVSGLVA